MKENEMLEAFLSDDFLAMVSGRAPGQVEVLAGRFRHERILVLRGCLNMEGLVSVRTHLDTLGRNFDVPGMEKSAREDAIKAVNDHVVQGSLVRAVMDDPRFSDFLSRVTGRSGVRIRKAGAAIYSKGGGETPPWHFDGPRVSLVIPIDAPPADAGGGFAYFPMMRSRGESRWFRAVRGAALRLGLHRLLRAPRVIPYEAGSILLFDGDTTYHRALSLTKDALRRSLLFFFDDEESAKVNDGMMM